MRNELGTMKRDERLGGEGVRQTRREQMWVGVPQTGV